MKKPLIGITAYSYIRPDNGNLYEICYHANVRAVERAGGMPVVIPSGLAEDTLRGIYDRVDAILLPGGGDVNPKQYTTVPQHPTVGSVDDNRDSTELLMTQWAVADDVPVFGICRGIQVMNVALGGTLIQDIPSALHTQLTHDKPDGLPRSTIMHEVAIQAGTRLADIIGTPTVPVNSLHHQAIEQASPLVKITAHATDGVPEALEIPDKHFVMAVQWHPEDMIDSDTRMQRLFDAFVQAARERMAQ